jgi:hypothetical protein
VSVTVGQRRLHQGQGRQCSREAATQISRAAVAGSQPTTWCLGVNASAAKGMVRC